MLHFRKRVTYSSSDEDYVQSLPPPPPPPRLISVCIYLSGSVVVILPADFSTSYVVA